MELENNKDTNVKATIDAVTGLVQAIPVYQDAVQPAAKQIGNSLEVVAKTVNIALAPIKALVWGYEKIEEFITSRVTEKLKKTPKENIITPPPQVAGPAVEALRYSGHDPDLRELYANLLANAMDKNTVKKAHPGFVEILKNMSSDEALLLKAFVLKKHYPIIDVNAQPTDGNGYVPIIQNHSNFYLSLGLKHIDLVPSYFDNLIRLGILEIPATVYLTGTNVYEPLENDFVLDQAKSVIEKTMKNKVSYNRKVIRITSYGGDFIQTVVKDK